VLPFISFPVNLATAVEALRDIGKFLFRIAEALDRIAPPPLYAAGFERTPYKAGLKDLRYTDGVSASPIREELARYAEEHSVQLDSEAFLNSIIDYERDIASVYGSEAILELPWNKAAGGQLFQAEKSAMAAAHRSDDSRRARAAEEEVRADSDHNRQPATGKESTTQAD
jgi:hypothetical protein